MITTVTIGTNADLFPKVLQLYAKPNGKILDMTYGNGVFWRNVEDGVYDIITNDLYNENANYHEDFRNMSFANEMFDCIVLDPPYMRTNNKAGIMANNYNNQTINLKTHKDILQLYLNGIAEARRLLKSNGYLFTKCQDETEGGKQRWTHIELMNLDGFKAVDMLLLIRTGKPMVGRCQQNQKTARKMHSYMLVHKKI